MHRWQVRTILAAVISVSPAPATAAGPVAVPVETRPVALDPQDPARETADRLIFRGGLHIISPDAAFGGISGLHVSADGTRFKAVTDIGDWLTGSLAHENGRLAGVSDVARTPLRDQVGASVAGSKRRGDAEALTVAADGTAWVAFERVHRIWRYRHGPASPAADPVAMPAALAEAVNNKGLESLALLADGTLLAITEATMTPDGYIAGWRDTGPAATPVRLVRSPPFDLTDIALLPSGDLLTLERRYSLLGGVGAQMRLIPAALLTGEGPLDGEIVYRSRAGETVDNMEGLAVRQGPDGETLIYVVSDDNFNAMQRTLLMMFELRPATP